MRVEEVILFSLGGAPAAPERGVRGRETDSESTKDTWQTVLESLNKMMRLMQLVLFLTSH